MATLSEARTQLAAWENASLKLSRGQVARVGDQRLDRADAEHVERMLNYWRGEVARLERLEAGQGQISTTLFSFPQRSRVI